MMRSKSLFKNALIISISYLFIGVLWILITDWGLYHFVGDRSNLFAEFEAFKGVFFILFSAILLLFISQDVLGRQRQSDMALVETENRYQNLVTHLPVGVYYTNLEGKIEYLGKLGSE